jgi:hypothetical protein
MRAYLRIASPLTKSSAELRIVVSIAPQQPWSKSCLVADSTVRTLAAMIASESKERAKQPKPCSHQNRQSADPPFRIRPEPTDRLENRACWQLRLRRRPPATSSQHRSAPRRRPRARSRRHNLRGSALWGDPQRTATGTAPKRLPANRPCPKRPATKRPPARNERASWRSTAA